MTVVHKTFIYLVTLLFLLQVGCDNSTTPTSLADSPTGPNEQAKEECSKAIDGYGDPNLMCNHATHSGGKRRCAYLNNQCVPATECGQLSDVACDKDAIAGALCQYDASSAKCTERFDCDAITDLSQCEGKPSMDPLGAVCRRFPVSGIEKCVPYRSTHKSLWEITAGPDAIVVKAAYHAIADQKFWLTFGSNSGGKLFIPSDVTEVMAIAKDYACGKTKSGDIKCFGDGTGGRTTPPAGLKFAKIVAREAFACGIVWGSDPATKNKIACWGTIPAGIQGRIDGTGFIKLKHSGVYNMALTPTETDRFYNLAITDQQLCANSIDTLDPYNTAALLGKADIGHVYCSSDWVGDQVSAAVLPGFTDITAGGNVFCGFQLTSKKAACFEDNHAVPKDNMNNGVFFKTATGKPKLSASDYEDGALADDFGCFLKDTAVGKGTLTCLDHAGKVLAAPDVRSVPATLGEIESSQFVAGRDFACAINDKNLIVCWGAGAKAITDTVPPVLKP